MRLREYLKTIFRYAPAKIFLLITCMVLAGALEGISYTLFFPLIKTMTAGPSFNAPVVYFGFSASLPWILSMIVSLFAVKSTLLFFQRWYASKLSLGFEQSLKKDIVRSVFESDWRFYLKEKIGPLSNAIANQSRLAADAFKMLNLLCTESLNVIVYCVLGICISFQAFLLSLVVGSVSFFLLKNIVGKSRAIGTEAAALKNEALGHVIEDFSGIKFLKGSHVEAHRQEKIYTMFEKVRRVELRGEKFSALMEALPDFIMACLVSLVLYVSYVFIHVPGENLLVLILVLYRLNRRLIEVQSVKQRLFLYLPSFDFCHDIIRRAQEKKEVFGKNRFNRLEKSLEFSEVGFSYEKEAVLRSVTMKVGAKEFVALVGRSGAGKTTVVDLMTGLLRPQSGSVLVDGVSLEEYDVLSWRSKIGYVSQEALLVNGTIEENIRMENTAASKEEIVRAAQMAHADEFIVRQAGGYETLVGDRGLRLSGGQRQRIALARAILRKPELLILDEATSALDNESERMVQESLDLLRGHVTIFVVAHRLSTIERADRIYVLDNGSIKDSGAVGDLKSDSALFQKLYDLN